MGVDILVIIGGGDIGNIAASCCSMRMRWAPRRGEGGLHVDDVLQNGGDVERGMVERRRCGGACGGIGVCFGHANGQQPTVNRTNKCHEHVRVRYSYVQNSLCYTCRTVDAAAKDDTRDIFTVK